MAIILRNEVGVIEGFSLGNGRPAIMDLHDDGRFVLVRYDARTQQFGEMIFDTTIDQLSVNATNTYLVITADGRRKRVDFAGDSPVGFGSLGLIGYAISLSYASKSGIRNWIDIFRERGVLKRHSNTRRVFVIAGAVLGGLVLLTVIVAGLARLG